MAYYITEDCTGCGLCRKLCPSAAVTGEKKEPHVIRADHCIECGACGRICPAGAITDPFREICVPLKKKAWPEPVFDNSVCMGCGVCIDACPAGALVLADTRARKLKSPKPQLAGEDLCIACGFCVDACPVDAVTMAAPEKQKHKKL